MKKYVVLVAVLAIALLLSVDSVRAMTPIQWVGDSDLTVGSTGTFVSNLQQILINQGFLVMPTGVNFGYFGPATRAAVIKYQVANSLPGTGFVGPLTRAKLNDVNVDGSLIVLSPNGGEEYRAGKTLTVRWDADRDLVDEVFISVTGVIKNCGSPCAALPSEPFRAEGVRNSGSYRWKIPSHLRGEYQVSVIGYDENGDRVGRDSSDSSFTIVAN